MRFRARPGLQPGCLHASHAAAFACAKPVFFSCALPRTTGLAARIGTPELPDGNERLAKGGKPVFAATVLFD